MEDKISYSLGQRRILKLCTENLEVTAIKLLWELLENYEISILRTDNIRDVKIILRAKPVNSGADTILEIKLGNADLYQNKVMPWKLFSHMLVALYHNTMVREEKLIKERMEALGYGPNLEEE